MSDWRIIHGDVLDVLPTLDRDSFDAVLCDPPYGLSFMGKNWDHGVPGAPVWSEVLRAVKPGAHLIAFGGTRTFHRLTCAIEDAGFEIRDCLSWLYGEGFPKSLDVSKAIDRMRDDREQVLKVTAWIREARDRVGISNRDIDAAFGFCGMAGHWTSAASQPAVPTIEQVPKLLELLGRDPPEEIAQLLWTLNGRKGQPGENWARREKVGERVGGIVPDPQREPRVTVGGHSRRFDVTSAASDPARRFTGYGTALKPAWEPAILAMRPTEGTYAQNALAHGVAGLSIDANRVGGRWPANVALDTQAAAALDQQSGILTSGEPAGIRAGGQGNDSGGASRFFYTAKVDTRERTTGNAHPTLKPTDLCRYLAKLLLPPHRSDGQPRRILVPFAGSGSEVAGALLAGWDQVVGIERDAEYVAIAQRRIPILLDIRDDDARRTDGAKQHTIFDMQP